MSRDNILNQLKESVISGDEAAAKKSAQESLEAGIDPFDAIREGLAEGMKVIGKQYREFEIYLPQVVMAADAMKVALAILESKIREEQRSLTKIGTVVVGTAFGDIHDIGKNILCALLEVAGFKVHDLGTDISNIDFLKKAKEVNADAIAISALLSASMIYQKDLIKYLKDTGIRERFLVVVGGGAVSPNWAKEIGADGYGKLAEDGVEVFKLLIEKKAKPPVLMEGGEIKT